MDPSWVYVYEGTIRQNQDGNQHAWVFPIGIDTNQIFRPAGLFLQDTVQRCLPKFFTYSCFGATWFGMLGKETNIPFRMEILCFQSTNHQRPKGDESLRHFLFCMENKSLLISINFTLKNSHSCLKKWYFLMFSRWAVQQRRSRCVLLRKMPSTTPSIGADRCLGCGLDGYEMASSSLPLKKAATLVV